MTDDEKTQVDPVPSIDVEDVFRQVQPLQSQGQRWAWIEMDIPEEEAPFKRGAGIRSRIERAVFGGDS